MILNPGVAQKFIDLFTESKKKDDLADAYLQCVYYIIRNIHLLVIFHYIIL